MIVLDTDHISVLRHRHSRKGIDLTARLASSPDREIATTVVTLEEQMRGWLSVIRRKRDVHDQISSYDRLIGLARFFGKWRLLRFD